MLIAFLVMACICMLFLYVRQDKMIFFPQGISQRELSGIHSRYKNVEDISLKAGDGVTIRGWMVKDSRAGKSPLIIYFGGNAEEVSYLIGESDKFRGWSLALMNYRGYGLSEGRPGERALFDDAITIYDYFSDRGDVNRGRIIVMGRSLGTGVAVYVAQNRAVEGVILVTPYDSLTSVAREKFPFLPISFLLKHTFDSVSRAPSIAAPLLALAAKDDTIIPPEHAKRLVEKWTGPRTLEVLEGVDHNSVDSNPLYWETIRTFLSRM
ncbi:MAG: alpha/beta hydrolase [Thermodesulfovibrionales bacterium]